MHYDTSHAHANDPAAKCSPTEVKAYDMKGDNNAQSAARKEYSAKPLMEENNAGNDEATSKSYNEAQVSSISLLKFFTTEDAHMHSSNISKDKSHVNLDAFVISEFNISPRGVGDCSIENIINM